MKFLVFAFALISASVSIAQTIRVRLPSGIVRVLPFEKYIENVVASEVPVSWPHETLKAQAVAARSYAWVRKLENSKGSYDVEATVQDQVYKDGMLVPATVVQATEQTRDEILWEQQRPVKAFFHSDCGGATEQGVRDAYCSANPKSAWTYALTSADLRTLSLRALGRLVPVETMWVSIWNASGRAEDVFLKFNGGIQKAVSALKFREWIGYSKIRSTRFQLQPSGSLQGTGFGHGHGLCQWGSRALGAQGLDYRVILSHYYPNSRIGKVGAGVSRSRLTN